MESHPYGWLSLMPPVVAIVLAIATRRAVLSLVVGIFCGALITTGGNPWSALYDTLEVHLWPTVIDPGKLRVFSFTLLMGAMIGVICRCGGMQGLIRLISPLAKSRRSGQLTTWGMGMIVFFDDYANTILLGSTLRPLCDRLKISREKLAYLVDSTAAPVAGLALISTWVAVEIDYVREGLENIPLVTDLNAVDLFIASIPYRFYVLMALVLVPLIAITGRDFGPMLKAERRRLRGAATEDPRLDAAAQLEDESTAELPQRWYNAVLPIVLTLGVVLWLLYSTGTQALASVQHEGPITLRAIMGKADSSFALQYGALAGLLLAWLLARVQRLLSDTELLVAAGRGARVVLPAIAILWSATALSRMTSNKSVAGESTQIAYQYQDHRLYTGAYLTGMIVGDTNNPQSGTAGRSVETTLKLLPTAVFLLAAVLSFSTGTSFGTMGILLPMVVALSHSLLSTRGPPIDPSEPILLATIGSVLAGAVFGDHCSPISDTTILSSQSCACDHIAHVVTQLPYALTVATGAVLFGTLPLGWGVPVWVLLIIQPLALFAMLRLVGRPVEIEERPGALP